MTPHTIMLHKKMLTTGCHGDLSHGTIKYNNEWDAKANCQLVANNVKANIASHKLSKKLLIL